jgi:DNA-binding CsgD family transcriptional regulator
VFAEPSSIRTLAAPTPSLLSAGDDALVALFMDRAPLALALADDTRRLVRVNGPWVELFGYPGDHALTLRIDDLLSAESRPGLALRWSDLMSAGAATARIGVIRADGSRVDVRYSALAHVLPGRHMAAFLVQSPSPARPARTRRAGTLTLREQESLRLVAMGLTTTAAAERLGISPETVRTHVRNAMNKLGARTRAQAIAVAMRDGEIPS